MDDNEQYQQQQPDELVADQIYYPHVNQLTIHNSSAKTRVVVAGRRFGKTALAINEALAWVMSPYTNNQVVWIILPQYNQAKKVYWIDPDINKYFLPYVQNGRLKSNDTELSLYCAQTNSRLTLIGADNPDALRGSGLDLIIWDEVADIKPEAFDIIRPTLVDSPHHRVIYMGTPDGYNHFHDYALRGDHKNIIERAGKGIETDPEWQTFKYTSYDNLTWLDGTPERKAFISNLDKDRKYYQSIGQADWFEQEYMAEFRKRAGAVHKQFSREIHLIDWFEVPHKWKRVRGWDFGSSHPTASVRISEDEDNNWFIESTYKEKDKTIEQHSVNVKVQDSDFTYMQGDMLVDPIIGYGDPSGAQWIREFNKLGFSIIGAKRNKKQEKKSWLEFAVDRINEKIAPKENHLVLLPNGKRMENAPNFFILNVPENQALVDELETLSYAKTAAGELRTEIDDTQDKAGHYDLHAGLRYVAVSDTNDISYGAINTPEKDPRSPINNSATVDLRDDNLRKELELKADLELMQNAINNRY